MSRVLTSVVDVVAACSDDAPAPSFSTPAVVVAVVLGAADAGVRPPLPIRNQTIPATSATTSSAAIRTFGSSQRSRSRSSGPAGR